jgi:hypothetical protein
MHFKHVFNIRGAKSTFGWLDHSGSEPFINLILILILLFL